MIKREIDEVERPRSRSRNATVLRTTSQYAYLVLCAEQAGLTVTELNMQIGERFGQTLASITKTNASKMITEFERTTARPR